MPLLLLSGNDIKRTYPYKRPLQGESKGFGRGYSYAQAIERAGPGGNRHAIDILHSITAFGQQALNAFQQLHAVVVAYPPGMFAEHGMLDARRETSRASGCSKCE